jgi:hypothetical protein
VEIPKNLPEEDEIFLKHVKWVNDGKGTVERAIKELSSFRLFLPTGSQHSPNGELLHICIPYADKDELDRIFALLEFKNSELHSYPDSYYQKFTGEHYQEDIYTYAPRPEDPIIGVGSAEFKGSKVILETTKNGLFINIILLPKGGRSWRVEGYHIDTAKEVEAILNQHKLSNIDPPLNLKNYVCPKYFPYLFTANKSLKRTKNSWFSLLRRLF